MGASKIIYGGEVKIDLTSDSVTPENLASGVTAHDKAGDPIVGTSTKDVDTSKATATEAEVLEGQTFGARGEMRVGTGKNRGSIKKAIKTLAEKVLIDIGFHDGSGYVQIDETEQKKIVPTNIRKGITVLGVVGSMTGAESVTSQSKTVTPAVDKQTVTPDPDINYLTQVIVEGIPYNEAPNSAGGTTITIG